MSITKSTKKNKKKKSANSAETDSIQSGKLNYEKLSTAMLKDKEKYASERFKECWKEAREISETITNTVWDDSMKIMQDYPSNYTRTSAICFFSFMCAAIDAYLESRYSKSVAEKDLPKIDNVVISDGNKMVKMLLEKGKDELTTDGYRLLEKLLQHDFGYLLSVLKAIAIENTALHNLLVSGFRFYVWEIMIPHLFISEKKKEGAHA